MSSTTTDIARLLLPASSLLLLACPALYSKHPRFSRRTPTPKTPRQLVTPHRLEQDRGRLPWPVNGTVTRQFGLQLDPRYGTRTKNQGIDIACRPGSPVLAIDSGFVSFADRFRGYGLTVILEHGSGFYSIYSRLREIRTSTARRVATGDTIGTAADTIHFELRIGGKPVDPLAWLTRQ